MFKNYKYFLKKDFTLNIFVLIELIIVYVVLNMSLSIIIQASKVGTSSQNDDAVGLFAYIGLGCLVLYLFTVAINRVVNHQKNLQYYVNCISLGGTKKMIFWLNVLKTTIVYCIAFVVGIAITLPLDGQFENETVTFFSYPGQYAMIGTFVGMFTINVLIDLLTISRLDLLKYLREGADNE